MAQLRLLLKVFAMDDREHIKPVGFQIRLSDGPTFCLADSLVRKAIRQTEIVEYHQHFQLFLLIYLSLKTHL